MNIWFVSDLHFGHKNIVRGISNWETGWRDYDTMDEYNQAVADAINAVVMPEDILYCIGDFAMGDKNDIPKYRKMLNVKTIHLILGNHDLHIRKNSILRYENNFYNAQNLFTTVDEYLEKKIQKHNFVMFHYPIASFHHESTGYHVFGHLHFNDTIFNNRGVNVCIDNHPEFRPFHIDEIINIIDGRQ